MDRSPSQAGWSDRFRLLAAIFLMLVVVGAGLTGVGPADQDHDHEDGPLGFLTDDDVDGTEAVTLHKSDLVTVVDQRSNGMTLTVQEVTLPEGGFVAVHDADRLDDDGDEDLTASIIGVSAALEPGSHEAVTVTLFDVPGRTLDTEELTGDTRVYVSLHHDTGDGRTFEYVTSDGGADGPYLNETGAVHVDDAVVTVDADDE